MMRSRPARPLLVVCVLSLMAVSTPGLPAAVGAPVSATVPGPYPAAQGDGLSPTDGAEASPPPISGITTPQAASELTLEDLYPEEDPLFGKRARSMEWSFDDRYLAYLWNPYEDDGYDLWVHDTQTGTSERITSLELMANFDREAIEILERVEKEKEEEAELEALSEEERREREEQERREKLEEEARERWEERYGDQEEGEEEEEEEDEEPEDYRGVFNFAWANTSHELLFVYDGDIYRIRIGEEMPERLTDTQESEGGVEYSKDDSRFYFRRGRGVFRASFDSPLIVEVTPELPKEMTARQYWLSPDETKILVSTGRSTGRNRQVDYITYTERFAQARTTNRGVADDPFRRETYLYLYDLRDDPYQNPDHPGEPFEVWMWPSGEEWGEVSLHDEPWAPDSTRVVFAVSMRKQQILEFKVADIAEQEVETIFRTFHDGGHNSPGMAEPFFTKDGERIVTLLEKSGFRHAWIIDPLTEGATQLTRGQFEVYPHELDETGDVLYASSTREHPARVDLYAVSMEDGSMRRLTRGDGVYGDPVFDHDDSRWAASFGNWTELNELYVIDAAGGDQTVITDSHPEETLGLVNTLVPELFSYENRHGHTIHGFVFHPPGWSPEQERPLMIYTYGGPLGTRHQVVKGNFHSTGYLFNMYLAARHGYVAATIDTRGNSGYGAAFESASWEKIGEPQTEDLSDGVSYLIDNHGVDPDKVALNGWSFGGFQTQHAMYTEPETFKLGIAGAGPTEWQNYNTWYTNAVVGDAPIGDPLVLDEYSLTHLAKNLEGPLLLLHGMEDTNVLFQDTIFVYRELLNFGKAPLVELVVDPTGGHGLGGDIDTKARHEIYEAFLMKHWGPYRGDAELTDSGQRR